MKRLRLGLALLMVLCGSSLVLQCLAQEQNAQINGRVLDSSGAAVPGASIEVQNAARGINATAKSNSNGEFVVPGLPPGEGYVQRAHRYFVHAYAECGDWCL